jgi:hypothetical protein
MGASETLAIILQTQADIKTAVSEMKSGFDDIKKNAENSAKEVEANYEDAFRKIRNASAIAFAGISAAIGFSTREAIQAEDSLNKVRAAVVLQGGDWGEWKGRVVDATGSMQEFTRFGDEELQDTLARMIQLTGDVGKSYDNLGLATDLAAGLQVDLGTAGDMVAKAMQGNLGMLGRYMPALAQEVSALGDTATMGEKAALIMERLSRFTGAAGEDAKTTGGQIAILKNQVGEAAEAVGNAFLPAVRDLGTALLPVVRGVADWAKENSFLMSNIGIGLISVTGLLAAVTTLGLIIPPLAVGFSTLSLAITGVRIAMLSIPGWGWAIAGGLAIGGLVTAIYNLETEAADTPKKIGDINAALIAMKPAAADATSAVQTFGIETGQAIKDLMDSTSYGKLPVEEVVVDAIKGAEPEVSAEIWKLGIQTGNKWREAVAAASAGVSAELKISDDKAGSTEGIVASESESLAQLDAIRGEYLGKQMAADKQYNAERLSDKKAMLEAEEALWNERTASIQAGYSTFTQSLLDSDMTGRERANAVWQSFASTAIAQITRMSVQYVIRHLAMKTVAVSTAATEQAAIVSTAAVSTGAAATEQASAISLAVAWMKVAYAKLTAFYGFLGPFAPVAAIATIGAALAGIAMVTKAALGFEQGGVVPGSGNRDSVPAMLTPGERVLTVAENREYERGQSGGGNQYHIHMDRDSTTDDVLKLRRLVQSWIVPMIEDAQSEGRFRPAGVPA